MNTKTTLACRKQEPIVRLIEVSAADLKIATDAILENWVKHWTSGGGTEYCDCRFCGEDQEYNWDKHEVASEHHKPDCAVLVARSIQPNARLDRQEEAR